MRPHVFRGLWCPCGARHHQGARYYVSVADGPDVVLALGPFQEHQEALARVDDVRRRALEAWNPNGRADWYGYGTTAMLPTYTTPAKLNAELGETP